MKKEMETELEAEMEAEMEVTAELARDRLGLAPTTAVRNVPATCAPADTLLLIQYVCSNRSSADIIELLKSDPMSLYELDEKGYTALHWAAYFDDFEAARCLVELDPSLVTSTSAKGYTPVHLAGQQNSLRVLKLLLTNTPLLSLQTLNNWDESPLHLAAQNGNLQAVACILDFDGSDQILNSVKDKWNRTAFDVAVENGHNDVASLLRPDYTEADIVKCRSRQLEDRSNEMVSAADRNFLTSDFLCKLQQRKKTADDAPECEGQKDRGKIIVRNIFSCHEDNIFGAVKLRSVASVAKTEPPSAAVGDKPHTVMVCGAPGPLQVLDARKKIAVSQKVEYPGNLDELNLMLASPDRYDVLGKDMFGLTALHKFASWDKDELVHALLTSGAACMPPEGVNLVCPQGFTALHYSVEFGAVRTLKRLLLDSRIDKSIVDKNGLTCVDLAKGSARRAELLPLFGIEYHE
jgi:ankyrin repeat protein